MSEKESPSMKALRIVYGDEVIKSFRCYVGHLGAVRGFYRTRVWQPLFYGLPGEGVCESNGRAGTQQLRNFRTTIQTVSMLGRNNCIPVKHIVSR
ncbi:hypothetical protein F6P93_06285 [Escherichia coli]|nr:hypothetical protein F6P93_06285 [Escherichia coli]